MWNLPSKERLDKIPKIYQTEKTPLKEMMVFLHFFIANSDWYICEFDGEDLFFGFCILGGDSQNAEWGYVSFRELKDLKIDSWLEVDCELEEFFPVHNAIEIAKIRETQGWKKEEGKSDTRPREKELIEKERAFQAFPGPVC